MLDFLRSSGPDLARAAGADWGSPACHPDLTVQGAHSHPDMAAAAAPLIFEGTR